MFQCREVEWVSNVLPVCVELIPEDDTAFLTLAHVEMLEENPMISLYIAEAMSRLENDEQHSRVRLESDWQADRHSMLWAFNSEKQEALRQEEARVVFTEIQNIQTEREGRHHAGSSGWLARQQQQIQQRSKLLDHPRHLAEHLDTLQVDNLHGSIQPTTVFTPCTLEQHSSVMLDSTTMLSFGGVDKSTERHELYSLRLKKSTVTGGGLSAYWVRVETRGQVPLGRHAHTCCMGNNDTDLFIIGGIGWGGVQPTARVSSHSGVSAKELITNRQHSKKGRPEGDKHDDQHNVSLVNTTIGSTASHPHALHHCPAMDETPGGDTEPCVSLNHSLLDYVIANHNIIPIVGHRNTQHIDAVPQIPEPKNQMGFIPDIYLYNTLTNHWRLVLTDWDVCICHHSCITYNNTMYIFGGINLACNNTNTLRALSAATFHWLPLPSYEEGYPPPPRHDHTAVIYDNEMIVFGGQTDTALCNKTYSLNLHTMTWHELLCGGDIPTPRKGHSSAVLLSKDSMVVVGGQAGDIRYPQLTNSVHCLNLNTQTWTAVQLHGVKLYPMHNHTIVPQEESNRFVLFGGCVKAPAAQQQRDTETHKRSERTNTQHNKQTKRCPAGGVARNCCYALTVPQTVKKAKTGTTTSSKPKQNPKQIDPLKRAPVAKEVQVGCSKLNSAEAEERVVSRMYTTQLQRREATAIKTETKWKRLEEDSIWAPNMAQLRQAKKKKFKSQEEQEQAVKKMYADSNEKHSKVSAQAKTKWSNHEKERIWSGALDLGGASKRWGESKLRHYKSVKASKKFSEQEQMEQHVKHMTDESIQKKKITVNRLEHKYYPPPKNIRKFDGKQEQAHVHKVYEEALKRNQRIRENASNKYVVNAAPHKLNNKEMTALNKRLYEEDIKNRLQKTRERSRQELQKKGSIHKLSYKEMWALNSRVFNQAMKAHKREQKLVMRRHPVTGELLPHELEHYQYHTVRAKRKKKVFKTRRISV